MTDEQYKAAERMGRAIAMAMPRIVDMWGAFPYAEMEGDDETMAELRLSAKAWVNLTVGKTAEVVFDEAAFAEGPVLIEPADSPIERFIAEQAKDVTPN